MSKTLLLNEDDLKELTVISANVDIDVLRPHIEHAQNIHTRRVVSPALFDVLLTQKAADTLTAENQTLVDDYISKSLAHWALYMALPFLGVRVSAKGIVKKSSDNSEPISRDERDDMRGVIRATAEHYDHLMIDFLKDNEDDYPEYRDEDGGEVNKQPFKNDGFVRSNNPFL